MGLDPVSIAVMGGLSTGAGVLQGVTGAKAQKKALRAQQEAQAQALAATKRQENLNAQEAAKLNRKKPDIAGILARAQLDVGKLPSTMLTGARGLPTSTLLGS